MDRRPNLLKNMAILFLVSFSAIVYEVFLPRFFSVILDYNFVFLVISLATLGLGLGGYLTFYLKNKSVMLKNRIVGIYALSIVIVVIVMYVLPYQGVWFYSVLALIPFLLSGWLISTMMQEHYREVNQLYFADLLGAGLGAVGAVFLMNELNPIRTIALVSLLLFVAYYLISFPKVRYSLKLLSSLVALLLLLNMITPLVEHFDFKAYRTSPNGAFYQEPEAKVVFTDWNAFTRTDVYDANDGELLYITIDGGAVSPISNFSGDLSDVDYLRATTSFLAFEGGSHGRALIIGAGGGQEVLTAQMAGYSNIEAVDINQGSFRAVQETASFSGNLFNQSNVKPIVSDGRNYIRKTKNQYDLIYLSLVTKKSENGLGLALTENYLYTQEAIKEYLNKLTGQGRLAFLLHDEKELYKILFSAGKVLKEQGVSEEDLKNHMAVIGTYQHLGHVVWGMNDSQITRPMVIIENKPFSPKTAAVLYARAQEIQQIPVHVPYVYDQFPSLQSFMQIDPVNVAANRDNRPFFYLQTNQVPWSLVSVLIITVLIAVCTSRRSGFRWGHFIYFSGLAIGFMLIEVTLIQRLILPLGHPALSFVLVLVIVLVSGGIGSLLSLKSWFTGRRYVPLLMVGILTIGAHFIIGWVNEYTYVFSQVERIVIIGATLSLLGFFMGMAFPFGLSKMKQNQLGASWGLNGMMTVCGSILAALISLTFGFTATMLVGAAIYAFLFGIQPWLKLG